jgi:hypothetical protein
MPTGSVDPRVAAVQKVAKSHDTVPRVREVSGGAAEVVSVRRGRLYRHRVDGPGSAVLLETSARPVRWLVGRSVLATGAVLVLLSFFAWPLGLVAEGDALLGVLFLAGVVVIWVGLGIQASAVQRLLNVYGEEDGWAELKLLVALPAEKPPLAWLSVAQLSGVERLTVSRDNESVVRDSGRDGVEVVTEDRRVLERHLVDPAAGVSLVDSCLLPRGTVLGRSLKTRAQRRYGGRGDWYAIDLRPTD